MPCLVSWFFKSVLIQGIIFYLDFLPFCLFVFLCLSQPCCFQRGWTESLDGFFAQFYMDSQGIERKSDCAEDQGGVQPLGGGDHRREETQDARVGVGVGVDAWGCAWPPQLFAIAG
jgi:hypothetical protein